MDDKQLALVLDEFQKLNTGFSEVKGEIKVLNEGLTEVKDEIKVLNEGLTEVKEGLSDLRTEVKRLDAKIDAVDAKVNGVDAKANRTIAGLTQLDNKVSKSIDALRSEMHDEFDKVYNILDKQSHLLDTDEIERLSLSRQVTRHDDWIERDAKKTGIRFVKAG